ncbi:MAG: hypothetical protein ACOC0Z_06910 [Halohasta sp.]
MIVKAVRKAGKKYAKKYARVTVLSILAAAVLTAVFGALGDPSRLSMLPRPFDVPLSVSLFLTAFVVCFVIGLLGRLVGTHSDTLKTMWSDRIDPLVARWNAIARRTRAIIVGVLAALVAGAVTAVAGMVVAVPLSQVVGAALLAWPVGTYWTLARSGRDTSGLREAIDDRSRYVELRHMETRTIALLLGYLIAAATAGGLWALGVETAAAAAIAGLVWLVATVVVYNRYETVLTDRTELAIVDTDPVDDELELSITNEGRETVELIAPTIRDTTRNRYRLADRLRLQPGGRATVKLPSTFRLAPTDLERTLPLGYTLDRSQPAPTVYSRTGTAFELQRQEPGDAPEDGPAWSDDVEYTPSTAVPAGTHTRE